VHDTTWFEINGKPSVFIASSEFIDAAAAQAEAHPIQDATDDEMRAKADAIVDRVIEALVD
jgi:hypothetical protein